MNTIIRCRTFFAVLFFAIVVCTASAVQAQDADTRDPEVCSAIEPPGLTDENMRWRLRAYTNLDCLMGKLEQARDRSSRAGKHEVLLSREEVEQLLNLAWWAKDAAQRAGR